MCCGPVDRRGFLGQVAGVVGGAGLALGARARPGAETSGAQTSGVEDGWDPDRPLRRLGKRLRVRPVLMYRVAKRRPQASWKSWGGVQSDEAAGAEARSIAAMLDRLAREDATGSLEILPVETVRSEGEVPRRRGGDCDVVLLFPASGSGGLLRASMPEDVPTIIFVRHESGPIYYWYEALSVRYLRTDPLVVTPGEAPGAGQVSVHDVVVDDPEELAWRLRALHAVRNLRGSRIVALGGPWGKYAPEAPRRAAEQYGLRIVDVTYEAIAPRLRTLLADPGLRRRAFAWTDRYLAIRGTVLDTPREFVERAFVLYRLFRELLDEHEATAFTIKDCMSAILPISGTTACLTLSLLCDEGLIAFCESDFVVIPAGILLRHLTAQPVFLHNSTFPHAGRVTCAHCAAPRRMDGRTYEPCRVPTHYESEYGAATKVEIPPGTEVSFIDPEYATGRWVGFRGRVLKNPDYEICRSQQDVEVQGDWKRLLREVRDSHWVMVYGDWLREVEYAAPRIGVRWETL